MIRPAPFIAAYLQQCVALMVSPAAWNGSSIDITESSRRSSTFSEKVIKPTDVSLCMFEKHGGKQETMKETVQMHEDQANVV